MKFTATKAEIKNKTLSDNAAQEIERAEDLLQKSEELLRICIAQVGMVLGEQIHEYLSDMNGQHFNKQEYHHERVPDGQ